MIEINSMDDQIVRKTLVEKLDEEQFTHEKVSEGDYFQLEMIVEPKACVNTEFNRVEEMTEVEHAQQSEHMEENIVMERKKDD